MRESESERERTPNAVDDEWLNGKKCSIIKRRGSKLRHRRRQRHKFQTILGDILSTFCGKQSYAKLFRNNWMWSENIDRIKWNNWFVFLLKSQRPQPTTATNKNISNENRNCLVHVTKSSWLLQTSQTPSQSKSNANRRLNSWIAVHRSYQTKIHTGKHRLAEATTGKSEWKLFFVVDNYY